MNTHKTKERKKGDALSWIAIVLAFVFPPFGSFVSLLLSIYLIRAKQGSEALAVSGLVFSLGIMLIFLFLSF